MSVDLNRLELAIQRRHGEGDQDTIDGAVWAVLDAPRVWWCVGERHVFDEAQDDGPCARWHMNLACGWVVLVPVDGEGR
jgi:hypothetical protein